MAIDLKTFFKLNVADTCAIWNVLSSLKLYGTSRSAECSYCCTKFVEYECLNKPRSKTSIAEEKLMKRLTGERHKGQFKEYHIDIDDLQDIRNLEAHRKLSKGELSSMLFAKKTNQAFLTDDQSARHLAEMILPTNRIQTTPHLFGWLFFIGYLGESDKDAILEEHEKMGRPLKRYFCEMYSRSMECKLACQN